MTSLAAALSEPATTTLLEYLVPAVRLAKPRPTSRTSQTPMTRARWRAQKTATRLSRDDTEGPPGESWGRCGAALVLGHGAADVDELEPEGLDAPEDAVQRGLIGELADQDGVPRVAAGREAVDGGDQGVAHPAADRDLVGGRLHGESVRVTRVMGHRTMGVTAPHPPKSDRPGRAGR